MRLIDKQKEPKSLLKHRKQSHSSYDNYAEKDDLRKNLMEEQGWICCYCMQRVQNKEPLSDKMKIEHWKPQSKFSGLEIDYQNILGACRGEIIEAGKKVLHCDTKKLETEITINPLNKTHIEKLKYSKIECKIYSDDADITVISQP